MRNGCVRGQGGGGGFLAHLLRLAAAGSAPPRPQKSKSPHPAKPASGRKKLHRRLVALTPAAAGGAGLVCRGRKGPQCARKGGGGAGGASAHLPRLLGRKRCGGLVDAAALRAAAAAATVAAARRWASHVRAAAAAPLPPLRGDGQAHSSSAGQKGLSVSSGSGPCWLFSSRWLLAHPLVRQRAFIEYIDCNT